MATKKTIASVKAQIKALEAELITLGDEEAKKKQALIDIEKKLETVNELLKECASIADLYSIPFEWETALGGTLTYDGYWPAIDWNSSNCY